MVTSLRVLFMGTPQFAVPTLQALLSSRHQVCGVVTQPDRARGRGQRVSVSPVKALALEQGIPVLQPDRLREPHVEQTLRSWNPDLGVVAAYGKLVPEALLRIPRYGMINVHASLLPRFRGAAPIHRAVMAGDRETGVTIMRVVKELDAGAMFESCTRPIGPDDTSDAVERDLADMGARLLVDVVDRISDGTATETPQDASLATYAPRLSKEEGLIDWSAPAEAIHNRVRGLYPWPHAYTFLDGRRLILLRTRTGPDAPAEAPGTVIAASPDGIRVVTGEGTLIVETLQPEGRRAMSAGEFLAGSRIGAGARFGQAAPAPADTPRSS